MLSVSMTGVKLGDRVVFVGVPDGARIAAIAAKVGLSGRAVAVVPDEEGGARVNRAAASAGVLIDTETADATQLPFADGEFDIAVIDDTAALLEQLRDDARAVIVREAARVLRPGGRVLLIGAAEPTGLGKLISKTPGSPLVVSGGANALLEHSGFGMVRTLAERESLVFVEGLKARTPVTR
jgi:ubiquinone/menaquinone biosynthesis C-methylase UbiE